MAVFNGDLRTFAEIEAGEYEVEEIEPLDHVTEDYFIDVHKHYIRLIWVRIIGTKFITAFCRMMIPEGITFTE
jgi:hypothetical protein